MGTPNACTNAPRHKPICKAAKKSSYNRNGTMLPRLFVVVLQRQSVMPPWHAATSRPPAKQVGRDGDETEWPHRGTSMTACGVTRRHCDNASACRIAAWRRRNATSKATNMAACGITARRANGKAAKRQSGKAAKPACHRRNATTWHIIAIPSYAPSPYRQHVALPRDPSRNEAACEKGAEPCGTHCAAQSGRATWDVRGQRGREP